MLKFLPDIVFGFFCLITVSGALYVLLSKNVLYAAFGLLVSFLGVAGIFVFGQAEFVTAAQVMIYVGGILVLLLFGIMLSANKKLGANYLHIENAPLGLVLTILVGLSIALILLSKKLVFIGKLNEEITTVKSLGFTLITTNILIIEIIGMLLLMALIGSTFITKEDE